MAQLEKQTMDVCAKQIGGEKTPWMPDLQMDLKKKKDVLCFRVFTDSLLQHFVASDIAVCAQTKMQSNFSFKTTVFGNDQVPCE